MRKARNLLRWIIYAFALAALAIAMSSCEKESLTQYEVLVSEPILSSNIIIEDDVMMDGIIIEDDVVLRNRKWVDPVFVDEGAFGRDNMICMGRVMIVNNWVANDPNDSVSLIIRIHIPEINSKEYLKSKKHGRVVEEIHLDGFPNGVCGSYIIPIYAIGYGLAVSMEADYSNSTIPEPNNNESFIYIAEPFGTTFMIEHKTFKWQKETDEVQSDSKILIDEDGFDRLCKNG